MMLLAVQHEMPAIVRYLGLLVMVLAAFGFAWLVVSTLRDDTAQRIDNDFWMQKSKLDEELGGLG